MKIGKLDFKDYAAKKPVWVTETGKFLTVSQIDKTPALGLGSPYLMNDEQKMDLVLKRFELEPEFTLGIIGLGIYTKDEVIDQIKGKTELGESLVKAELGYCNELIGDLAAPSLPTWPIEPKEPIPEVPDWRRRKRCIFLKLVNRALFCENTTDRVTNPFAQYRIANVHPVFQARGFTNVVLQGQNDIRANFIGPATSVLVVYISGVGHGSYGCYTGHFGDDILRVGAYDAAEVTSKAIHFLSCQTARDLGPDTIANGAHCYAGYNENFRLIWDDGTTPAVNEFELFARSDSTFDIMMANGFTAQAAFNGTVQAFNAARALVPNTFAASLLTWDRDHLQLHGDPQWTIKPYRYVKICYPIAVMEEENALVKLGTLME